MVAGADLGETEGDHPDDREMRISHETIYQSLFVQSRGELRKQLTVSCGRAGRAASRRAAGRRRAGGSRTWSHLAAARGDRGSCGAGALGGRSDLGGVRPVCDRDAGGAPDPVCAARPARERPHAPSMSSTALSELVGRLPGASRAIADLGSGQGTGRAQAVHGRDRRAGVLLRSALPVAARDQREHQRAAAPIPPQGHRPRRCRPGAARPRSPRQLNGRPRKTLDWMNPAEKMAELLATAQGPRQMPAATIATPPRPTGSAPRRRSLHPPNSLCHTHDQLLR